MEISLSNRHQKAINACINEAHRVVDMPQRLGSVALSGGKIISKGHNHSRTKIRNRKVCSFHAEVDVLSRLLRGTYNRKVCKEYRPSHYCQHAQRPQSSQTKVEERIA